MTMRGSLLLLMVLLFMAATPHVAAQEPDGGPDPSPIGAAPFADAVDLTAFGRLAVHHQGRVKSFDSFAAGMMKYISGARRIDGRSPSFTYLDLMLRPELYERKDCIYVKNKLLRAEIARTLDESLGADRRERFMKRGLISPELLRDERAQNVLTRLSTDLMRTAKFVENVQTALAVQDARTLRRSLRLVPPPSGTGDDEWFTPDELAMMGDRHPALADPNLPAELREEIVSRWIAFTGAWTDGDAAGVNEAAAGLASSLLLVNTDPAVYPDTGKLSWESWYFRHKNMTWVWLIYAVSLVPLLLFVVFRWNAARWTGLGLFLVAFGFHTFAVLLRWYVSGRWPNSNMFEAITTAAWFGGCFAVLFELFARRSPVRGLIALCSAAGSMTALMATRLYPLELDASIGNMMPVLHDVWLYIHTNVIIFSYALIFMASITALLYVLYRGGKWLNGREGVGDFARAGGAASLIMTAPEGGSTLARVKTTVGQVLDGTTMILIELSFVLLWAGIVMGAIWADHSWGRPWGWDPKEVFALNTFIVFALLIHVRLKVRDKGLWTAVLAVIGCGVMLFNWVIINFTIAGLHSYA